MATEIPEAGRTKARIKIVMRYELPDSLGARTIVELEAERDEVLLGLIELRKKAAASSQTKSKEPVA